MVRVSVEKFTTDAQGPVFEVFADFQAISANLSAPFVQSSAESADPDGMQ